MVMVIYPQVEFIDPNYKDYSMFKFGGLSYKGYPVILANDLSYKLPSA